MLNTYNSLPEAPLDPIMLAAAEWTELQKTHDDPINTTVGVLNDPDSGKIWRPLAVEEAFIEVAKRARSGSALGYQTQAGNAEFLSGMARLVFGDELAADLDGNSLAFQGLGGTGALSLAGKALAALLRSEDPATKPTLLIDGGWPNHPSIFQDDFTVVAPVRTSDNSANHDMMMEQMHLVPERTALLLQACGYNDDGIDRTDAQWNELLLIAAAKDLPVIIDSAYLGLANGLDIDRYAIKQSQNLGLLTFVAASSSKNMGLYGERVGALFVANTRDQLGVEQQGRLKQAIDKHVRRTYSSPPMLAAKAVGLMLQNRLQKDGYKNELTAMQSNLLQKRHRLAAVLGKEYSFVGSGRGLFTKLLAEGFSQKQRAAMSEAGILTLPNSRINIGGIPPRSIERVGATILEALK